MPYNALIGVPTQRFTIYVAIYHWPLYTSLSSGAGNRLLFAIYIFFRSQYADKNEDNLKNEECPINEDDPRN